MKILVVGEINPDLVMRGYNAFPAPGREVLVDKLSRTLGGASAICAIGLAKLGRQVSFLGKRGPDHWGEFCAQELAAAGVDVSRVICDPALQTGFTVSLSSSRDRALITFLGAIAALRSDDVKEADLDAADHVHISSFFLQERLRADCRALFARAKARGATTSLDPGYDPSEKWGRDLVDTLAEVDVFLPNEVELAAITGRADPEAGLRALSGGRTLTVVKLGPAGCMGLGDGAVVHVPAFEVEPVDTTGAGDSFNAGFLHAWLEQRPLREALRFASACGAISTQGMGGTGKQASAAEAAELLRRAG